MVSKKTSPSPRARKKKTKPRPAAAKAAKRPVAAAEPSAGPRRAVFIDVENTSNELELARVLDELKIDPQHGITQISAIGNWRAVGQHLGRSLAERGAVLVHSAPAARIRDWSDLWIAVQAGIWLGRARAGDTIEIVSHDRAFDAVGDAAAQLGVAFRRITYRAAGASTHATESEPSAERQPRSRRRRGGRGRSAHAATGSIPRRDHAPSPIAAPARHAPAREQRAPEVDEHEERHGASPDQLLEAIARLVAATPTRTTTLDALTNALKAAGFHRPPGSPRLVTRLRQVEGVEVLAGGKVRLIDDGGGSSHLPEPPQDGVAPEGTAADSGTERRPRRRGRRRRGGRGGASSSPREPDAEG